MTRLPHWAWVFIVLCAAAGFLTVSRISAVQGAISFGAAIACVMVARDQTKPTKLRLLVCLSITAVCGLSSLALMILHTAIHKT